MVQGSCATIQPFHFRFRSRLILPALFLSLALAWVNFLTTGRWANLPGSLERLEAALSMLPRSPPPRHLLSPIVATSAGACGLARPAALRYAWRAWLSLVAVLALRLPMSLWLQIPFKDDWTPLFQQAVNGVGLLKRGVVVGWNWWFLGGYPTSTDIAQNFGTVAFIPMTLLRRAARLPRAARRAVPRGPAFVWWDLRHEDRETRRVGNRARRLLRGRLLGPLGSSGDTNSLAGVCCAGLALVGSRARAAGLALGRTGLDAGADARAYTHAAFFVYAAIFLTSKRSIFAIAPRSCGWPWRRLVACRGAAGALGVAALSRLRQLQQHGLRSGRAVIGQRSLARSTTTSRSLRCRIAGSTITGAWRTSGCRVCCLAVLPGRRARAFLRGRGRHAAPASLQHVGGWCRLDRIQHMFPLLTAPAFAGFVLRFSGTRPLAPRCSCCSGCTCRRRRPIRHVAHCGTSTRR